MRRSGLILAVVCSACRVEPPTVQSAEPAEVNEPDEPEPPPPFDPRALVYLPAPGNGVFQLGHEQPSLALIIELEFGDDAREALALQLVDDGGFATLDDQRAEQLGLERPPRVWMFGSSGPCEAKLGSAYAIAEHDGPLVLELGFVVEPCAEHFAPVAYLGATPPALSWRDVECSRAAPIEDVESWTHPERSAYEQLGLFDWKPDDDHASAPEQHWIRSCKIDPVVTELAWSWVWPSEPCWNAERVSRDIGVGRAGTFEPLPRLDEGVAPELIGALMAEDQPAAILGAGWPELHIGTQIGGGFVWTPMIVGGFHDEVVAASDDWSVLDCDSDP